MTVNDKEWKFLAEQTGMSAPFNDMYFAYLRGLGYTGTLQDMIAAYGYGLTPSVGWETIPLLLGPSLLAWWTADRSDLLTLSGSAVISWQDVIANLELTQSTSDSRPLWSVDGFNGSPQILFDGVNDFLNFNLSGQFPTGGNGSEIWAIVDQTDPASSVVIRTVAAYGNATLNGDRRVRRNVISGVNRANAAVSSVFNDTHVDLSGRHLMRGVFGPVETTGTGIQVDDAALVFGSVAPTTVGTQFTIGSIPNGTTQYWKGGVRDVLVTLPLTPNQSSLLTDWGLSRRNV